MTPEDRVFVAGHRGLVGSAIVRRLRSERFQRLLLRGREELDLADGHEVERFFASERPEYVVLAAARVGGILANDTWPVEFLAENLTLELNVIGAAYRHGARKLLFLGSSCIYPRLAPQPIREESLLSGHLEPTNEAYAIAKIAGIKLCQAYAREYGACFISAMPTNLYGPNDNFELTTGHVVPALMRKFHEAKEKGSPTVEVWGSGEPRRELLYVDDLADACVFLLENYEEPTPVNVGVGHDMTIAEVATLIGEVVGFRGDIRFDRSKPDGVPRKLLDVSRLTALGWKAATPLREGLARTYDWFLDHAEEVTAS